MERLKEINTVNYIIARAEQEIFASTGTRVQLLVANPLPEEVDYNNEEMGQKLLQLIADALGMRYSDYSLKGRAPKYVHLRQIGAYMIRMYVPKMTLKQIAQIFNCDHTTVLHNLRQCENLLNTNDEIITTKYDTALQAVTQWIKH